MKRTLTEPKGRGESARTVVTGTKLSPAERVLVDRHARQYTAGCVSKWMRIAILKFKPQPEDFE